MSAPSWQAGSLFGAGPRKPLNRDQRGIIKQRLRTLRLRHHITALHEQIGLEFLQLLGSDGRLDPSQETIARRVGCCVRTVSTALRRLRRLKLLDWLRRLIRVSGLSVQQTSNAYFFLLETPIPEAFRCERKFYREARVNKNPPLPPRPTASSSEDDWNAQVQSQQKQLAYLEKEYGVSLTRIHITNRNC